MPKTHPIKVDAAGGYFSTGEEFQPGDTILLPEKGHGLYLGSLKGTPDNPIKIGYAGTASVLTAGIDMEHAQNVIVDGGPEKRIIVDTGKGEKDRSKLVDGQAFKLTGFVKNVTITNCQMRNVGYAGWIKNEASCDDAINKWVIKNVEVSNCIIFNTLFQGFYCHSTDSDGIDRPTNCKGVVKNIAPARGGEIRFIKNKFHKTGRAAIQISLSSEGMSLIEENDILEAGLERSGEQGNGINIGGFSRVRVHKNKIDRTHVAGIAATGAMEIIITDNDIDNSGYLFPDAPTAWAWGIWIATRKQNLIEKMRFEVTGNKIGRRGQGGPDDKGYQDIIIAEDAAGFNFHDNNKLFDNISKITGKPAVVKIDPRIKYSDKRTATPPPPVEQPAEPSAVVHEYPVGNIIIQLMRDGSVKWLPKK